MAGRQSSDICKLVWYLDLRTLALQQYTGKHFPCSCFDLTHKALCPRHPAHCTPCKQNQDEWVPLEVVRDLVEDLFAGSVKLLGDICPAEELNWQELSLQAS